MTEQTTEQTDTAGTLPVPGVSLHDHAMQEINAIEAGLTELERQYAGVVYDVTTKEGMDAARAARQAIRDPRYKVEKVRAETSSELTRIRTVVNAEAKRITERIEKIEEPIHQQIKAEEDRIEADRAERRRIEAERVAALRASIDAIKGIPLSMIGAGEAEIREAIDELNGRDLSAEFDDVWLPDAIAAKNAALPALDTLLSERIAAAERQAALEAEAAEKARAATEAAALERAAREEAERAAAAQREQEEQERRAAEEAQRAAKQAERDRQARITAAIDDIRRKAFAPAKSSADIRALQEALAGAGPLTADVFGEHVQEAEAARAEALDTLAERLRMAIDQEAEAARMQEAAAQAQREAEERAEAERQEQAARAEREAQARAQAEADAIAAATLRSAAQDALDLLQDIAAGDPRSDRLLDFVERSRLASLKLEAALNRETQA